MRHLSFFVSITIFLALYACASGPPSIMNYHYHDARGRDAIKEGNFANAEKHFLAAISAAEEIDPQHGRLAAELESLARVYIIQARFDEAETALNRALIIRENAFGTEAYIVGQTLEVIGILELYLLARYDRAKLFLERALAIGQKIHPPDNNELARTISYLGVLNLALGNYGDAEKLFIEALAIVEKNSFQDDILMSISLDFGNFYYNRGRFDEAEPLLSRALSIAERLSERKSEPIPSSLMDCLRSMGLLSIAKGRFKEAELLLKRSFVLVERWFKPDHFFTAYVLDALGQLYKAQGRFDLSERLYQDSLEIFERDLGTDHPLVADGLYHLAKLYQHQSRYSAAIRIQKQALDIRERALGPRHPKTLECVSNLAELSFQLRAKETSAPETIITAEIKLDTIPIDLQKTDWIAINGKPVNADKFEVHKNKIKLLGDEAALHKGLNLIEAGKRRLLFWWEEQTLKQFHPPYKSSYVIIAAIDDYDRSKSKTRSPSGYRRLDMMIEHAEELRLVLQQVGFPEENIFTFYDENATAAAIERALYNFWTGEKFTGADRLFFYFGGHGDAIGDNGYIVTYDHDQQRPTRTSILMRDLTGRHFENISAHHLMVVLDACSAGLSLPFFLSNDIDHVRLREFRKLTIIRGETEMRARNVLVAGTGEQRALWENGGIFTQSLIAGLKGQADYNEDRIIQFEELALYVKNRVRGKAAETGFNQVPSHFQANKYGHGNILFLRPNS